MRTINLAALAALGGALLLNACSKQETSATSKSGNAGPAAAVSVEAEVAVLGPLARSLEAVGSLRSDESVTLSAEVAGRVARIGFEEGRPVKAGATLFELDDSVQRAQTDQARANLLLSQRNAARAEELYAQKLVSAQERDQTAATLAVNQAALKLAEAQLAKMRIVAPFSGTIGLRLVSPGDYVTAGQQLVNLEALDNMKVDFRLPEIALPALAPEQALAVEIDALPGEVFAGKVYAIDPRVADTTRSIGVRARIANTEGRLRPGLFARVRLTVENKTAALLIPEQAIFPRGEQLLVYVITDGKAELREINVGQRLPGKAEVLSGIRPGEQVITSGLQKITAGTAVQAVVRNAAP